MTTKTVFLPNYSIGENSYEVVTNICQGYGKKVVFIGGKTALSKGGPLVREAIKGSHLEVIDEIWFGGEASYENVERLKKEKSVNDADMVFVFGGGKAIDTCKCLTDHLKKPLFTFPTIASTCASVTTVCAIYDENGVFSDLCWRFAPAEHTFINTKIIAEAPEKYLWAGIGDTMAKGYEPEFSSRGKELDHSNNIGVTVSKLCQEPLVKYGKKALEDCKINKSSKELEETILAIIITTGIVSNYVINDYNSSLAHALCYGFSTIHHIESHHLHGEIVSYGVLVLLMIDGRTDEIDRIMPFYKSIGLPTSYKDLEARDDEMEGVVKKASELQDIVVSAFDVTRDVIWNGIRKIENYRK